MTRLQCSYNRLSALALSRYCLLETANKSTVFKAAFRSSVGLSFGKKPLYHGWEEKAMRVCMLPENGVTKHFLCGK